MDSRTRKWTVNGAIRNTDLIGCYYLDPVTQSASQDCLDVVKAGQFVTLWGARASGKSTRLLSLQKELARMGYRAL
jgi:energy-coupling factor transporter ATP-binding protein EcfA2